MKAVNFRLLTPNSAPYNSEIKDKSNKEQVDTNGAFILPTSVWTGFSSSNPNKYLLFEGASEGNGQLELVFLDQSGNQIGEGGSLWLDLKNIKKMYQRGYAQAENTNMPYTYTGTPPDPNITLQPDPNTLAGQTFQQPPDETPQCIVFVHGFNITYAQSTNSAESMFKRLWWRGYKGRFAAFRWPAFGDGTVPWGAVGTYNQSEYMAWNSGAALKLFVSRSLPSSYAINIAAHSMGNLVTGEALREGMSVQHNAMLHAATSASCYGNADFSYQTTNAWVPSPDTDTDAGTRNLAYTGWLGGIGGNPINFYDIGDSVVGSIWDTNNSLFKPQHFVDTIFYVPDPNNDPAGGIYGYKYFSSQPVGQRLYITFMVSAERYLTSLNDQAEAKAFLDHSLTGTIGGANKGMNFQGGSIGDTVNDNNFGDNHSNEWDWNIQDLKTFYNTLLLKFELPRNP